MVRIVLRYLIPLSLIVQVVDMNWKGGKGNKVEKLAKKLESTKNKGQKIDLIPDFYIPNTRKKDIYEFVIAQPQIWIHAIMIMKLGIQN